MMIRSLRLSLAVLLVLASVPAAAQDIDPETGEVYIPPEQAQGTGDQGQTTAAPWYAGGPTGQAPPPEAPPDHSQAEDPLVPTQSTNEGSAADSTDSAQDDHMRVVGNLAVGFMGLSVVPIGSQSGVWNDTVSAPALGVRYWIGEMVGLDVGIGIGYIGGSQSNGMVTIPSDNAFAMVFHAGLPLALFHADHFKLLIIPELNFGFATGTAYGPTSVDDRERSGILFQIGGRIGTEIHFGFMEIPQLSLQASVGLYFDYLQRGLGEDIQGPSLAMGESQNEIRFGTTVQGEPWDIILGALSALYYFE